MAVKKFLVLSLRMWIVYWIKLAEGLVGVLTFGMVYLGWHNSYSRWLVERKIKNLKKARKTK